MNATSPHERMHLVILSHNRLECLRRLLQDVATPMAERGVQVTLVDNGSDQDVQAFLRDFEESTNIDILLLQQNAGVAKGRNAGFRRSSREIVVYLDDDALIDPAVLEQVPQRFDEMPDAGIVAFRVVHGVSGDAQNEHGPACTVVGNFHGAGHAIRRTVLDQIGYLDETCFFGAEEIELSMRALVRGWKTVYHPDLVVRHFSIPRRGADRVRRRVHWARNYAMVLFRYLPPGLAALFTTRLLVSYLWWGFRDLKFPAVVLPFAVAHGALRGLRTRNPLPAEGVAFYKNPATRPEIGNVSLMSKIFRRNADIVRSS